MPISVAAEAKGSKVADVRVSRQRLIVGLVIVVSILFWDNSRDRSSTRYGITQERPVKISARQ